MVPMVWRTPRSAHGTPSPRKGSYAAIDLVDYQAAEYAYEGGTFLMTQVMEVTTQVLNDYRKIIARLAQQQADNTYIKI